MVAEVEIHLGVTVFAENEQDGGYYRENSQRQERVANFAQYIFVVGILLLNLMLEEVAFLPDVKYKEEGSCKNQIAEREDAEGAEVSQN